MPDGTTWRLNATDEMLYGSAGALGSSRAVQVLWRFSAPVSADSLEAEWHRLNEGRLSRQVAGSRVFGARRKWVMASNEELPHIDQQPLTEETVMDWIDAQVRAPLPVGSGALWRLAAAPYQGGSLVSLTVPHFRSDGLGIFNAIARRSACAGPPRGLPARVFGSGLGDELGSDLGDALGQTARAAVETARWTVGLLANPRELARIGTALFNRSPGVAGSAPRYFTSTIFDVDAELWEERARAHGGTANSLFVEIAANLIRARVPRDEHATVDVGLPMNLRRSELDERANALVVVPLTVAGGTPQHSDLQQTRQATKALLRGAGAHSTTLVPEPLWHVLPADCANRLKTPGAQQTDVVASNFGHAPEGVVHFADQVADSIALRTMNVPGLVPEKARLRASLCLLQVGSRMTVTVTGMPDHFGDAESLQRLVADEFAAWGLTARQWWSTAAHDMKEGRPPMPQPQSRSQHPSRRPSPSPNPMTLPERWFRTCPDSSVLPRPRLLTRSLIDVADLDDRIAFYEQLLGVPADLRMPIPDFGGLELAAVGNLLLIASARPFTPIQRKTAYSLIVPSLGQQLERLRRTGTVVLEPPEVIVPGSRARVRYPDGTIAELVEHRPQPGERPRPQPAVVDGERSSPQSGGMRLLSRRAVRRAALDSAVALYESVLETELEARIRLDGGPDSPELAIVGNLLLVGSDELSSTDAVRAEFALLTGSVDAKAGARRVIALPDGTRAEVWGPHHGLHAVPRLTGNDSWTVNTSL